MRGDARLNRWRGFDRLMNPDEIVVEEVQGDGVFVVFKPFAESVGQASEPAHREVLAFDVGRADVLLVRRTDDRLTAATVALAGAVAAFRAFARR